MIFLWLLVSLLTLVPSVSSERILFLTPMGSKSHKIFFMGVAEALAEKGHHVTMVSAFEPSRQIQNIREVVIDNNIMEVVLPESFADQRSSIEKLFTESPRICSECLAQKNVQDLKNEKFDLIMLAMFFDYCFLSLVHHFKIPYVFVSPAGMFVSFANIMNNADFPSIEPQIVLEARFPLSFKERLVTLSLNSMFTIKNAIYMESRMEKICKEKGLCPQDMPSLSEMNTNASLAILNSVRALDWPARPMMPNIIYAGGIHIKPAKKLPQDLENWINDSGDEGFIFFSTGSALRTSMLPENYRKILINVFGSVKYKVLWKWDNETMSDLPKNVKLRKWFPQSDIIGHPKLRLFITHGGLLSTQEATYHSKPVIGMPVFADQFANINNAVSEGWGKVMHWKNIEENSFKKLIVDTINDENLKVISRRRSDLMKDLPISPSEEVVFWVEYVMRHKGAEHMKSPFRLMRWYEIYNMDIWALVIGILCGVTYLLFSLLKLLFNTCGIFKSNNAKRKKE